MTPCLLKKQDNQTDGVRPRTVIPTLVTLTHGDLDRHHASFYDCVARDWRAHRKCLPRTRLISFDRRGRSSLHRPGCFVVNGRRVFVARNA